MVESAGEATPRRGRPGYDAPTVLRRAIEVFNRQGYEATSIGDLARELGVTKSAIYHHVPSKEALLAAALDEALDELENDEVVRGALGETVYKSFVRAKRAETLAYRRQVTPWEREEYLERV